MRIPGLQIVQEIPVQLEGPLLQPEVPVQLEVHPQPEALGR